MLGKVKRTLYKGFVGVRKKIFTAPEVVLNNGERFDPFLTKFHYQDVSHVPRYEFASKLISTDESVTDIACGTGWGTEILARTAASASGVDISETAIGYAIRKRKGNNLQFVVSDFFDYDTVADVVVSFETIEHIRDARFEDILGKLVSLARRRVIGSVPYREEMGANPHHVIFNVEESYLSPLESVGHLKLYYQDTSGKIRNEKNVDNIQNLLFTLEKN